MIKDISYDAVLCDIKMPKVDGIEVLEKSQEINPDIPFIMISGHGTIETAVRSTKLGAFDFIEKPLLLDKTILVVKNAWRQYQLQAENQSLRKQVEDQFRPKYK